MSGANTHMNEHPSGGTRGGASVEPTPANNVGGGQGWGDSGFLKGGTGGEGTGHISDWLGQNQDVTVICGRVLESKRTEEYGGEELYGSEE
ncbi:hypothetical protein APSETT444_004426 [Aspergillus pseudonomiae]